MNDTPAARAERLFEDRRRRAALLPAVPVDDHGWAMMLWLFARRERRLRASTADLFAATEVSRPTGERWLALLRRGAMLDATSDDDVALSDVGHGAVSAYLATPA